MTKYVLHRVFQMIPLLVLVSVLVFALLTSMPGEPMGIPATASPRAFGFWDRNRTMAAATYPGGLRARWRHQRRP